MGIMASGFDFSIRDISFLNSAFSSYLSSSKVSQISSLQYEATRISFKPEKGAAPLMAPAVLFHPKALASGVIHALGFLDSEVESVFYLLKYRGW